MKLLLPLLALAAAPLFGADNALPEFNSNTIGHPPLSLSEAGKPSAKSPSFSNPPPAFEEMPRDGLLGSNKRPTIPRMPAPRLAPKSAPGSMPILEPNPAIDYKIVVKAPDPSVDFKMLINPPDTDRVPAK